MKVVARLIAAGADPTLLSHGPDVAVLLIGPKESTALHLAVMNDIPDVMACLLSAGADVMLPDTGGISAGRMPFPTRRLRWRHVVPNEINDADSL